MTEIEIIKELFKASSGKEITTVISDQGEYTGIITFFDGESVSIDGNDIKLSSIKEIVKKEAQTVKPEISMGKPDVYGMKMKKVNIAICHEGNSKDLQGVVVAVQNDKVVFVTEYEKKIISIDDIKTITELGNGEILSESNCEVINDFENAILVADKLMAEQLAFDDAKMQEMGYSGEEIKRIQRNVKMPLSWSDDEFNRKYNQARRIYEIEKDRNDIAYKLFIEFITEPRPLKKNKIKALGTLLDIVSEKEPYYINDLFDKQKESILNNVALRVKLVSGLIKVGQYDKAREIIDNSDVSIDFGEALFALDYYECNDTVSALEFLGDRIFDVSVNHKEIKWLLMLPSQWACAQLLNQYTKTGREYDFFLLLQKIMPRAREVHEICEAVGKMLNTCSEEFFNRYFIQFPMLWLRPELASRYCELIPNVSELDNRSKNVWFVCDIARSHVPFNDLENAVIKGDYQLFDVLRGNNSILFSLGYSSEEISRIQSVNVETLRNRTSCERLYMLQENRNNAFERMAMVDFLCSPLEICKISFPVFDNKEKSILIYEIFNYSEWVKGQLYPLKPYYLHALFLLDNKELFWNEIKESWISDGLNKEMLEFAKQIALTKEEKNIADAMDLYSRVGKPNDFELAIIDGNITKIRTFVTDITALSNMGYDSDDIRLIQENIRQRLDLKSDSNIAIANRVYTFQRNKNNVAELYYKMAMLDGDLLAAHGLFSLYESESRYDELRYIYEKYLVSNEELVTEQMRESYLYALYVQGEYNLFAEYYTAHKHELVVSAVVLLEVLLVTGAIPETITDLVSNINVVRSEDIRSLVSSIKMCVEKSDSPEFAGYAVKIFNTIFKYLKLDDVKELIPVFEKININNVQQPMGNGVLMLASKDDDHLIGWCEYLRQEKYSDLEFVDVLEKIDTLIVGTLVKSSDAVRNNVISLYKRGVVLPERLLKYLLPDLDTDEEKRMWLQDCVEHVSEVDDVRFEAFCKIAGELQDEVCLLKLISKLSKSKKQIKGLKMTIISILRKAVEKNDVETVTELLDAIMNMAGQYRLNYDDAVVLFESYILVGNYKLAYVASEALKSFETHRIDEVENKKISKLREILNTDSCLSLFSVLSAEFEKTKESKAIEVITMWKGLFKITEGDTAASEELRDYSDMPEKWSAEAKDLLIRHLIYNPKSELFWQLLGHYYMNFEPAIRLSIEFQHAKVFTDLFSSVLVKAVNQGLNEQAVDIIGYLLNEADATTFDMCFKTLSRIINRCPEAFARSEIALIFVDHLINNQELCCNSNAISFVMELAQRVNRVNEFADIYVNEIKQHDAILVRKLLCKVVLESEPDKKAVKKLSNILENVPHEIAYRQLLLDLCEESDFISGVNREILGIIVENDSEILDEQLLYRLYTRAVVCDAQKSFLSALDKIRSYYPSLAVYDDIKKYEMTARCLDDDEILEVYNDEYEQLMQVLTPDRIVKTIINMIPGEMYLSAKDVVHQSAFKYGIDNLPSSDVENIKYFYDMYVAIAEAFGEDKELKNIVLKSCFLRQWKEFVLYQPKNKIINDIVKNDHSFKKILLKRRYEVLKWVFLSMLEAPIDDENIIERAYTILSATGIVRFNKGTLKRFYKMEENYRNIVRKIFSIRMESATLRKMGAVGESILEVDDNEKVAYLICTLDPGELSGIFNNELCFEKLMNMPLEKAKHVAEIYAGLYSEGRDNVFLRAIASLHTANDAFAVSDSFSKEEDVLKGFRKRYQKQMEIANNATGTFIKQAKRSFELAKAEYLFEAIIKDSYQDYQVINPRKIDYISVITLLFNRREIADIKEFIWKMQKEELLPAFSYVMQLLEQYAVAYNVLDKIEDEEWKQVLCQVQYRAMVSVDKPIEREIREQIKQNIVIDRSYWIGKFIPATAEQVPVYVEKMKALYSFAYEFEEYLSYNGVDVSWINIDSERFYEGIRNVENKYSQSITPDGIVEQESTIEIEECVADYLSNDILEGMPAGITMESVNDMSRIPQSLEECLGIIKYYATVKRESKDKKDILALKDILRWTYIKVMDEEGYSRDKFMSVLKLMSKDETINKSQWMAILLYLVKYFDSMDSLVQLSRMLESDLRYIQSLAGIRSNNLKFFRIGDLKIWENIGYILNEISGMDFLRINENEQMQQLVLYRTKLLSNGEGKASSSFTQINNMILRLINNQITGLKDTAELSVSVLEENKNHEVSIVWEKSNNRGYLYALISNNGGAECESVVLISKINVARAKRYVINKIYPGEKIPFRETFSSTDLVDNQVNWDMEVSYCDAAKGKQVTVLHHITACVSIGGETLDLGNINTGNPAKGKNFVGRTRELALLKNRFSDEEQLPSMLIRGLRRSGKSSILIQLSENLKKKDQFVVVFVDGQSIGDDIRGAFVDKVIDGIRISYRNEAEYKEIISTQLNDFKCEWTNRLAEADWIGQLDLFYFELSQILGKKILVIIDEMESIFYNHRFESVSQEEALYSALRSLIQRPDNYVSFIFCGSDTLLTSCLEQRSETQMFQTLQYLEVGHMNHGDIQEIFRQQSEKHDIYFSQDAVEAIWEITNGLVWYAKLLGYLVINNIFANDFTIRKEVNRWDIYNSVQMLINGEIGTDKYDLVDASLSTPRTAIVHAMAGIMPDYNKEVSVEEIHTAYKLMKSEGYINSRNGEKLSELNEETVKNHLDFLEKMQFVESNASKTKYSFTAELYRLFFRNDKKLHLFEERGQDDNETYR